MAEIRWEPDADKIKRDRRLHAHDVRALSVLASVDPRTIENVFAGRPVRPMGRERIRKALASRGIDLAILVDGGT